MRGTSIAILLVCTATPLAAEDRARPSVGAIRWDAWSGGRVTEIVQETLGPEEYHDRLPWFADVIDRNTVRIDGSRPGVMDREIEFAADAGLDYWAFLIYPKSNSMSTALEQYLASRNRPRIGFCLILHNTLNAAGDNWPMERDRAVGLLKEEEYQTVLDGRPLVFAFTGADFPFERFSEFLDAAREAGLNPYSVFMGWNPAADYRKVSARGFNAVSAYAKGGGQERFSDLVEAVEQDYWNKAAEAKVPYVPLVTTGWDKRPRKDHPVPWELDHGYHRQETFPSRAAPREIAPHLQRAVSFVEEHREICTAQTIIVYSWNEHDEGGWLSPTLGTDGKPDVSRLRAIRSILNGAE